MNSSVDFGRTTSANKNWHYVYLLKCNDGTIYKGCTNDIKDRINRHKNGHVPATKQNLPVELFLCIAFHNKYKAFEFEKYLKSGSDRAFMNMHFL